MFDSLTKRLWLTFFIYLFFFFGLRPSRYPPSTNEIFCINLGFKEVQVPIDFLVLFCIKGYGFQNTFAVRVFPLEVIAFYEESLLVYSVFIFKDFKQKGL